MLLLFFKESGVAVKVLTLSPPTSVNSFQSVLEFTSLSDTKMSSVLFSVSMLSFSNPLILTGLSFIESLGDENP